MAALHDSKEGRLGKNKKKLGSAGGMVQELLTLAITVLIVIPSIIQL